MKETTNHRKTTWLITTCILGFMLSLSDAAFSSTFTAVTPSTIVSSPLGIFYNSSTDKLFIAKQGANTIRIDQGGVTSEIAGTASVPINYPFGLWVDSNNNIFVVNHHGHNVIKIASTGQLSKFAGTGSSGSSGDGDLATLATFSSPTWVSGDATGNVFICDYLNNKIRKVNKSDNKISTVAGTGESGNSADGTLATSAQISAPLAIFVHKSGQEFFFSMWGTYNRVKWVNSAGIITTIAGNGASETSLNGILAANTILKTPCGIWGDAQGNVFVAEREGGRVVVVENKNNYEKAYLVSNVDKAYGLHGDDVTGKLFVSQWGAGSVTLLNGVADPSVGTTAAPSAGPSALPSVVPSALPSTTPSQEPSRHPTASPSSVPSVVPSSAPSEAPTLAVPEYSLTVSAKSFKYFEVRVFTEANVRVFPVSYELVDCPENAGAVIWGHESTPVTEDTNTCVNGLPRHYWCECPALVNGNKPKLTLNFGGTVFDRVELLILDWVDGEVVVSDSANNIVLFSASRAGGPLLGEEFVGYDHLNLLQVAPSVVPTVTPSSVPTTKPSWTPTTKPTIPSIVPTHTPTMVPTTTTPSAAPSVTPSIVPSAAPSFTAQYTITLTAKTFKYFEVRVYTHDNLRIFPVSYELEHCPENAGIAVWNDQTTEDTNTCVYGYPRNFWCACAAVADERPKLVLHMGHTVFDRVELLLLNWEDGEVTVTDEANHETFLSATHDGVGNEFVTFDNLNLEHAAAPARRLLRGG